MVVLGVDTLSCGRIPIYGSGGGDVSLGVFSCPDDEDEVMDLLINGPEDPFEDIDPHTALVPVTQEYVEQFRNLPEWADWWTGWRA